MTSTSTSLFIAPLLHLSCCTRTRPRGPASSRAVRQRQRSLRRGGRARGRGRDEDRWGVEGQTHAQDTRMHAHTSKCVCAHQARAQLCNPELRYSKLETRNTTQSLHRHVQEERSRHRQEKDADRIRMSPLGPSLRPQTQSPKPIRSLSLQSQPIDPRRGVSSFIILSRGA
jgi:hypothetical protein